MKDPLILIINPFHSVLEKQIVNSLTPNQSIEYLILDSVNLDFNNIRFNPSLILVLLDDCPM